MKYFRLYPFPDDMGQVPQAEELLKPYSYDAPNSIRNALSNNRLSDLLVPQGIPLKNKAKWTDLLTVAPVSFPFLIVSKKMLGILESIRLPEYFAHPVPVIKRDKVHEYYIFIAPKKFIRYINLETCEAKIITQQEFFPPVTILEEPVEVRSEEIFDRILQDVQPPRHLRIVRYELNPDAIEYDIFLLPGCVGQSQGYIVSEQLVKTIDSAGLAGVTFGPLERNPHHLLHPQQP